MPFIEFSTAFSFDFGRRRKISQQLPPQVDDDDDYVEKPSQKLGFQPNEPKCDCEECR